MNPSRINLNADLGESFGAWSMGSDDEMLRIVGSANVACGFHAGDPLVMRATLSKAREAGVSVGAHPSYPDLQGFGRRRMAVPADELEAMLIYQIGALDALARAEGLRVTHVKPHGALSNTACEDRAVADTVARATRAVDPQLVLLAPALSPLVDAGIAAGLRVVHEIYADRAYLADGRLVPRSRPDAMVHGAQARWEHVARMLEERAIVSVDGTRLPCEIGSICVHGDGPDAVQTARELQWRLAEAGCTLVGIPEIAA